MFVFGLTCSAIYLYGLYRLFSSEDNWMKDDIVQKVQFKPFVEKYIQFKRKENVLSEIGNSNFYELVNRYVLYKRLEALNQFKITREMEEHDKERIRCKRESRKRVCKALVEEVIREAIKHQEAIAVHRSNMYPVFRQLLDLYPQISYRRVMNELEKTEFSDNESSGTEYSSANSIDSWDELPTYKFRSKKYTELPPIVEVNRWTDNEGVTYIVPHNDLKCQAIRGFDIIEEEDGEYYLLY